MTDLFDTRIGPQILAAEGGYVNDPHDAGGETNHGITVAVARANGWAGPMRDMPISVALGIYRRRYWSGPGFDAIAQLSPAVAEELCDTGVNMGPEVACKFLQRSLNVLNRQAKDYPDVGVDGDIGPATMRALTALFSTRGKAAEAVLLKALNALQGARYIELAESRAANEAFEFGWLTNRVGL